MREAALSVAGCREDSGRTGGCRSYILGRTQLQAHHCEMGHLWREILLLLHRGDAGLPGPANSPVPRAIGFASWVATTPDQIQGLFEPPLNIVVRTPGGSSFLRSSLVT